MFFFNNEENNDEILIEEKDDKKVEKKEYGQVEYGKVPFITFICVILSKLAYLPDCGFLPRYEQIFGEKKIANSSRYCNNAQPFIKLDSDIEYNPIPTSIFNAIKDANIEDIFNDSKIFKKCQDINFYTDSVSNEKFVDFIKYAEFFNILNGSTNKRKIKERFQGGGGGSKNKYVQYISLAWSNYSIIYIVADKRSNTIFIVYRGTASFKGITSYINFNTFNKNGPCDSDEAFIPGIFKITTEAIHTLLESVFYLATHFLKATANNSVKVLATGHSLGGAMASIFAYLYTGIRNNNKSDISNLSVLSKQIVCISVGAPRCINDATLKKYNHFINQNLIMYRRLVTKGDPVPQMPHKAYFGYHHPGDDLKTKNGLIFCESTYSGLYGNFIDYDKSSNCKSKEDSIGSVRSFIGQHNQYDHLNYLYVSYLSLVPVGFKTNEIDREPGSGDTVMRVILGSNKYGTKIAFFNLVKSRGANYKKPLLKFLVDVHNQDILMTHKAFLKLISLMKPNNNDNPIIKTILNEQIFDSSDEAPNLNCFTTYFKGQPKIKTRRIIGNKKGTRKKRN
jgi:hypothetical protein